MRILAYGAGAVGSVYAARLAESGNEVAVLARGERSRQIAEHGIVLEDGLSGRRTVTPVRLVHRLAPGDEYDLALVAVRAGQVADALLDLAANVATPTFLFMVNTVEGYAPWIRALGPGRLLAGFPGAGGAREGHVVRWALAPRVAQPTLVGEPDGGRSRRAAEVAALLRAAGFPVALSDRMEAWQRTHVAWAAPLASALLAAGGARALSRSPASLRLLVHAVRENLAVLRALGVDPTPRRLSAWARLPAPAAAALAARLLRTRLAEVAMERHAFAAREEARALADGLREQARAARRETPASDRLAEAAWRPVSSDARPVARGPARGATGPRGRARRAPPPRGARAPRS